MYLEHFGLREAPFRITPHTGFFFAGANRGATLEALLYAITNDEGIVKVTGEVGSGKTMLCRMLLERLPEKVETIYLANPLLSRDELLYALADELKMPAAPQRIHLLLRELQQHLIKLYGEGKQVVVVIDEAHAMPAESLEEIRLLSNLESRQHKLLQIVLFGQPELNTVLSAQHMRQLRERVTHNFHLEPLQQTDVGTYLMFRLRAAGYHGPDLFTPAALKIFSRASQGLTRRLNILADKALLAAFAADVHQVDVAQSKAAVKDAKFEDIPFPPSPAAQRGRPWIIGAGAALLAGLMALGVWLGGIDSPTPPDRPPPTAATQPAPQPIAVAAAVAPSESPPLNISAPIDLSAAPTLKLDTQATTLKASIHINALRDRFEEWAGEVDGKHQVIQLIRVPAENRKAMDALLSDDFAALDPEHLRMYEASAGNQRWLGLVYGDFAGVSEAEQALKNLPASVARHQAFIRPVLQLKPYRQNKANAR